MSTREPTITFPKRDFKGSRARCLLLTSNTPTAVAAFLQSLVASHAEITAADRWAPRGFLEPDEAKLGETPGFLEEEDRETLTRWWLARRARANTLNWDLVSTCRIKARKGLVLVEAKSHEGELANDRCTATDKKNLDKIEKALGEANEAWNALAPGAALSANAHYQLSNRFAFSWKLASMGIPVVLVYLGFLDAWEMSDGNRICLRDRAHWRRCLLARSRSTVPETVWDKTFDVGGTPLTIAIRAAAVGVYAKLASDGVETT
jgi:hypothetical protein